MSREEEAGNARVYTKQGEGVDYPLVKLADVGNLLHW